MHKKTTYIISENSHRIWRDINTLAKVRKIVRGIKAIGKEFTVFRTIVYFRSKNIDYISPKRIYKI